MKKIMLGAAALMIGAVTFAQNTSNVTSTGDNNVGVINQTTAGGTNNSTVTQEFTNNRANVDQTGTNNSLVDQNGNNNGSSASGQGNIADVDQVGGSLNLNRSTVIQSGDFNYANADQDGNGDISRIQQGGPAGSAENNWARVLQSGGDNNNSSIEQFNDNNFGLATQTGNANRISMFQNSRPGSVPGNSSRITQVGDDNFAVSEQTTEPGVASLGAYNNYEVVIQNDDLNYSKLVQLGNNNSSRVDQSGNTASTGWANRADVEQLNNLNTSIITQGAQATVITDNFARVRQDGSTQNNRSTITQNGANSAFVTQNN